MTSLIVYSQQCLESISVMVELQLKIEEHIEKQQRKQWAYSIGRVTRAKSLYSKYFEATDNLV